MSSKSLSLFQHCCGKQRRQLQMLLRTQQQLCRATVLQLPGHGRLPRHWMLVGHLRHAATVQQATLLVLEDRLLACQHVATTGQGREGKQRWVIGGCFCTHKWRACNACISTPHVSSGL